MRAFLLPLLFLLFLLTEHSRQVLAQSPAPTFDWTKSVGGSGVDDVFDVTTDAAGNSYVAAHVSGTASFGNLSTTGSSIDFAVGKFDASGICLWVNRVFVLGSNIFLNVANVVYGVRVATDAAGNVYLGYSIPTYSPYTNWPTAPEFYQYRLQKYSPAGVLLWTSQSVGVITGPMFEYTEGAAVIKDLLIDESGCPVLVCRRERNFSIDGQVFTDSLGGTSTVLIRYSPSGALRWLATVPISNRDYAWGVGMPHKLAKGPNGQIWVAGAQPQPPYWMPTAPQQSFIARYDTTGVLQYSANLGQGTGRFAVRGIADAGNGSIALSGTLSGSASIGTTTYTSIPTASATSQFILQMDQAGNLLWMHQFASTNNSSFQSQDITADASGNITLASNFANTVTVGTTSYSSNGSNDILLARIAAGSGTILYSGTIGGSGSDIPRAVQADIGGVVTMVGRIDQAVQFGPDLLVPQGADGYITRFSLPSAFSIPPGSLSATGFCAGASFPVSFSAFGLYQPGNQFVLQLSDSSGSFANPTVIGTLAGTAPGTIQAVLPPQVLPGTGYRIRVIATAPATISADNGTDLSIWAQPQVSIATSGATVFCQGDSIVLSSSQASGNLWSTGSTASQLVVTGAGQYSVTYTDPNGCSAQDSVSVTVNPLPAVSITASGPTTICPGDSVVLSSSHSTGNLWSSGSMAAQVVATTTGINTLTYTDANGCSAQASVFVLVKPMPAITLVLPDSISLTAPAIALTTGSPNGGVYSGAGVSAGVFDPGSAGLGTHTITYTYTDANGCTGTATQPIVVYLIDAAPGSTAPAGFRYFPNPATDQLQVEWHTTADEGTLLLLTDMLGKVVYQEQSRSASGSQVRMVSLATLPAGVYVLQLRSGLHSTQAKVVVQK